jgi:hypothetical protein
LMILLSAICHIILGVSTNSCNFIIGAVMMMIKMAMATQPTKNSHGEDSYNGNQTSILNQLPTSLYTALNQFNIDGHTTMYAMCPSCNFTHKPAYDCISAIACYPDHCVHRIVKHDGSSVCGTSLLEMHNSQLQPIKPYQVASFSDYLA